MDCGNFEKLIYRLPDGDLSDAELAALQEHVDQCDVCRALYDAMTAAQQDMAAMSSVPEGFSARVMDAVHEAKREQKAAEERARRNAKIKQRWRFGDLGLIAACLALVVVVVNVMYGDLGSRTANDTAAEAAPMMLEEAAVEAETTAAGGEEYAVAETVLDGATATGTADSSAMVREAAKPMTEAGIPVLDGNGSLAGTLDADTLAAVLTDADGSTAGTDAPPTWTVEADGAVYELFVMDEVLFWRTQGGDTLTRSSVSADEFTAALG